MNLKIFKKLFIFNKMASNAIKRILNKAFEVEKFLHPCKKNLLLFGAINFNR